MRKAILLLVSLILISSIIVSCATPTPQIVEKEVIVTKEVPKEVIVTEQVEVVKEVEKERPKLSMWVDHNFFEPASEGYLKALVLEYAQKNGFDIEYLQDSPEIMLPRLDAATESKTLPDIIYSGSDRLPKVYRAGLAMDLTDLVEEMNKDMGGFAKGYSNAVTRDGKQFAIPILASIEEFYFRQDLLDAKGLAVPQTWEEVLNAARLLNDPPNVWGVGFPASKNSWDADRMLSAMLMSYCASVWSEDGTEIRIDSPETRQALELFKAFWDEGLMPEEILTWDDSGNNKAYQTGKVAMVENTGSIVAYMKENDRDLLSKTTLTVVPGGPCGRFVQSEVFTLIIPTTTKYPELVKGLASYLMSPEIYPKIIDVMGGNRIPTFTGLADMELWQDPTLKPLIDSVPFAFLPGYPGPVTDAALLAYDQLVVGTMAVRMLADGWTTDQAIEEAVESLKKIQEETQ